MKQTTIQIIALAWFFCLAFTAQAQQERRTFKGEGSTESAVELTGEVALEKATGAFKSTEDGFVIAAKEQGVLVLPAQEIMLDQPSPFIAASAGFTGEGLNDPNLKIEYRYASKKGNWSNWKIGYFDHHTDETGLTTNSILEFLEVDVKYIQYKLIADYVGQDILVEHAKFTHHSPGETPEEEKRQNIERTKEMLEKSAACSKPYVVSRSSWGALYSRTGGSSRVTHLVVHHEYGSNYSSDWAARVRAVQRYHQVNLGWRDAGYNFMIDPNGVIYEGRAGGDNAIGAHTCGANTNTMGICMLGNYSTVVPTSATQTSVKRLLAWKADKENINPLASAYQSGMYLRRIYAHRDRNCSACPGNGGYSIMGSVRSGVNALINSNCSSGGGSTGGGNTGGGSTGGGNTGGGNTGGGSTDTTAPTTAVSVVGGNTTVSDDFQVQFTDNDNVGVTRTYYQVLENYGPSWYANRFRGYFNDNFNTLYGGYSVGAGDWTATNGRLKQGSSSVDNTRLSTYLAQSSGLPYLYEFSAKVLSTSGPKKFGMHIMASSQTDAQRGNSYLIWFSGAENKLRVYETINNVLYLRSSADLTATSSWAKYRITYSPAYGVLQVFRNNTKVLQWIDSTPITTGSSISLRTNMTEVEFDDLKTYRFRVGSPITISVGSASTDDVRTSRCKVNSAVRDAAGNWSAPAGVDVNIAGTQAIGAFATAGAVEEAVVFPTLVKDQATLRFNMAQAGAFSAQVMSLNGQLIGEINKTNLDAGVYEENISSLFANLQAGVYMVKTTNSAEAIRVIKQ
ncbi:MAG: N-acetylmuramoyl-L-alanine amidase [Bacteroidota bacterium]